MIRDLSVLSKTGITEIRRGIFIRRGSRAEKSLVHDSSVDSYDVRAFPSNLITG